MSRHHAHALAACLAATAGALDMMTPLKGRKTGQANVCEVL